MLSVWNSMVRSENRVPQMCADKSNRRECTHISQDFGIELKECDVEALPLGRPGTMQPVVAKYSTITDTILKIFWFVMGVAWAVRGSTMHI